MAAFENKEHEGRLVLIPQVSDAFADLHFNNEPERSTPIKILGVDHHIPGFQVNEPVGDAADR
ncbi:site-specific integrase, partial [Pseudomonas aeruginosa]